MPNVSAGSLWLKEYYKLEKYTLTHNSYIGSNDSIELTSKGNIEQVYGPKYTTKEDTPSLHLEFSLKYDDLNLDFLRAVFENMSAKDITAFIEESPSGRYARKIGFLYEFLTGNELEITKIVTGNYVDLLEADKYITGNKVKNSRWRINDNLLGKALYCPIVRKTRKLNELLNQNIAQKIEQLKKEFPDDIFQRATNYLYNKETRSSYEIEKEQPSPDRMQKFIALLMKAGIEKTSELLNEDRLVKLQNAIVDPRYVATAFRNFQNYVGESSNNFNEIIHYICPPPTILASLMEGLKDAAEKTAGIYPEIRAAIVAFGFVFIHPFEDGNGRLHRFLIHDILVYDGIVPQGIIIPVSAHMLNNIRDYDKILESYSKPLMQRIKYTKEENEEIKVTNNGEVEGYFRYPDLTEHCIYLAETIHATLKEDMPNELVFIQRYDEVKKALQNIVDMPDKDINLVITFLHQNKGVFPKRRREQFPKLKDHEIHKMQSAYREIFELPEIAEKPDTSLPSVTNDLAMVFTTSQKEKQFTLENKASYIEIKKIVLTPLFEWKRPDEWSRIPGKNDLYVQIICSNNSGAVLTSAPYSIMPDPFQYQPVFLINPPINIPNSIVDKTAFKSDYPIQVTIQLLSSTERIDFDVILIYDESNVS
ncbi:MAG: Fic family protein [Ferruginibacter sp.]|nr:Fic family protein [Ferruginibacter sp.]